MSGSYRLWAILLIWLKPFAGLPARRRLRGGIIHIILAVAIQRAMQGKQARYQGDTGFFNVA